MTFNAGDSAIGDAIALSESDSSDLVPLATVTVSGTVNGAAVNVSAANLSTGSDPTTGKKLTSIFANSGSGNNDTIDASGMTLLGVTENMGTPTMSGGNSNDTLIGGESNDTLYCIGNNGTYDGGGGDDNRIAANSGGDPYTVFTRGFKDQTTGVFNEFASVSNIQQYEIDGTPQTVDQGDDSFLPTPGTTNSPNDWNSVLLGGSGTFTTLYSPINGNPGAAMDGTDTPSAEIVVGRVFSRFAYDPSTQGPITSITWNYDYQGLGAPTQNARPLVKQGDNYYDVGVGPPDFATNSWTHYLHANLTAADFVGVGPTPPSFQPDFGSSGQPIQFGFTDYTGVAAGWAIDNFEAHVNNGQSQQAPQVLLPTPDVPPYASHLTIASSSPTATAGTSTTITVSALDASGNRVTGYNGTIHLTSPDPRTTFTLMGGGQLQPGNYFTFSPGDGGTMQFQVKFGGFWNQTVTAADVSDPNIEGEAGFINEVPVQTGAGVTNLIQGPDGNGNSVVWFDEVTGNLIGYVTPGGTIKTIAANSIWGNSQPFGLCVGPDTSDNPGGLIWFTEVATAGPDNSYHIGYIDPATLQANEISLAKLGVNDAAPYHISASPDGKTIWFVESDGLIIQYDPKSNTVLTQIMGAPPISDRGDLVAGPDGNLWYTSLLDREIVKVDLSSNMTTAYPLPATAGSPSGLTVGPDGNLWFTAVNPGAVGRMDTSGNFTLDEPIPGSNLPGDITSAPDGYLWFPCYDTGFIEHIAADGQITAFGPLPPSGPYGVASDAAGSVWFSEGDNIAHLTVPTIVVSAESPKQLVISTSPQPFVANFGAYQNGALAGQGGWTGSGIQIVNGVVDGTTNPGTGTPEVDPQLARHPRGRTCSLHLMLWPTAKRCKGLAAMSAPMAPPWDCKAVFPGTRLRTTPAPRIGSSTLLSSRTGARSQRPSGPVSING